MVRLQSWRGVLSGRGRVWASSQPGVTAASSRSPVCRAAVRRRWGGGSAPSGCRCGAVWTAPPGELNRGGGGGVVLAGWGSSTRAVRIAAAALGGVGVVISSAPLVTVCSGLWVLSGRVGGGEGVVPRPAGPRIRGFRGCFSGVGVGSPGVLGGWLLLVRVGRQGRGWGWGELPGSPVGSPPQVPSSVSPSVVVWGARWVSAWVMSAARMDLTPRDLTGLTWWRARVVVRSWKPQPS